MSITPLNPLGMPPLSPEPQSNEGKIIRRWLWRQMGALFRASLFVFLGMLLGVMLTGRLADKQILAAQQQTQQCVAQLETIKSKVGSAPRTNPVIAAVGTMLGIPPQLTELAQPLLDQAVDEVEGNLQRSADLQRKLQAVGQDRVIQILLAPDNCGTSGNADCILKRMCETAPTPELQVKAEACQANAECWRGVLKDCGAFKD